MSYIIENNVEKPTQKPKGRFKGSMHPGSCTHTMNQLQIGQSFVANSSGSAYPSRKRLASTAPEKKFDICKMPNNEIRVFRTA